MVTNIVSPFTTSSGAPLSAPPPAVVAEPVVAMPQDVVTTSEAPSGISGFQKAGLALMTGVTLVGGGLLSPATAQARDMRPPMMHSQVMHGGYHQGGHHGGGNAAGAIVGGIIGGIIGGAIANGGMYYPPAYPAPMPMPVPVSPGYNGVGADGAYHHFDQYGHVADQSGHYNLAPGMYGGYVVTPAPPHY